VKAYARRRKSVATNSNRGMISTNIVVVKVRPRPCPCPHHHHRYRYPPHPWRSSTNDACVRCSWTSTPRRRTMTTTTKRRMILNGSWTWPRRHSPTTTKLQRAGSLVVRAAVDPNYCPFDKTPLRRCRRPSRGGRVPDRTKLWIHFGTIPYASWSRRRPRLEDSVPLESEQVVQAVGGIFIPLPQTGLGFERSLPRPPGSWTPPSWWMTIT
jgi:hypothetical protein